jgi:hypothetical protein
MPDLLNVAPVQSSDLHPNKGSDALMAPKTESVQLADLYHEIRAVDERPKLQAEQRETHTIWKLLVTSVRRGP